MIWKRYLFLQQTRAFGFFCLCFYLLYTFIDLSSQVKYFEAHTIYGFALYYACQFIKRIEFLFPIAFAIAQIKVLHSLSSHNELIALEGSGLSKRKLLSPFFAFAALLAGIMYAVFIWGGPAQKYIEAFQMTSKRKSSLTSFTKPSLYPFHLPGGETLFFQSALPAENILRDVFLISTGGNLWHMDTFSLETKEARGVDHFYIDPIGHLHYLSRMATAEFQDRDFELLPIKFRENPYLFMSLIELIRPSIPDRPIMRKTELYAKLFLPWLPCAYILILPASAVRFRRQRSSPIWLYTTTLVATLVFFAFFSGCKILAEQGLIAPSLLLLAPLVFLLLFSPRFFFRN